jgi:hypothetical protein
VIERLFDTPYNQSQVRRAVKRVDDGLHAIKANPPARRTKRTTAADPSQNEAKPKVAGGGQRVVRKVVDDRDD